MKNLELINGRANAEHSLIAMTFDMEVKRLAAETSRPIGEIMTRLSEFTGLDERQLYNYRQGKTDIPALLIPVFCKQFKSNALAMAVVSLCEVQVDEQDAFDLARFCSGTVREMLKSGEEFMDICEDGKITGNELLAMKNTRARIIRSANKMYEVAATAHDRRVA